MSIIGTEETDSNSNKKARFSWRIAGWYSLLMLLIWVTGLTFLLIFQPEIRSHEMDDPEISATGLLRKVGTGNSDSLK